MQKCICYLVTILWLVAGIQNIQALVHGEECAPDQDKCDATLNLVCDSTEKKCVCKPRYWFDESPKICNAALGTSCETSEATFDICNMIPYALCNEKSGGNCQCTNGYNNKENIFCEAPRIGDHCLEDGQCVMNAACATNKCTCVDGFVPLLMPKEEKDLCIQSMENLGDACTEDDQCAEIDPIAECITDTCACSENYVNDELNEKCLPVARKIGDQCSTFAQCSASASFGKNARCVSGACVCKDELTPSLDSVYCLPKVALTEDCVQDRQCSAQISGSECFKLKCECMSGYENIDNKLCSKEPVLIGDTCTINRQCTDISKEAECSNAGICECKVGFFPTTDKKKCLKGAGIIGSDCTDTVQCLADIPNSVCDILTKKCLCKANYVSSENEKSCLKEVAGLHSPCTDNGQCTAAVLGEVECKTLKCDCKPECHYSSNTCWNSKRLGDGCANNEECILAEYSDRVVCREEICQCKDGLTEDKVKNKCNTGSMIVANGLLWAGLLLVIKNIS